MGACWERENKTAKKMSLRNTVEKILSR